MKWAVTKGPGSEFNRGGYKSKGNGNMPHNMKHTRTNYYVNTCRCRKVWHDVLDPCYEKKSLDRVMHADTWPYR